MPSTAELLDAPVLGCTDTARVLQLWRRNGEPNRRAVHDLIRSGAIVVVDDTQPVHRWTVASGELRRYIAEGSRTKQAS